MYMYALERLACNEIQLLILLTALLYVLSIGDTEQAPIISPPFPPLGVPAAYLCTPADVIKTRLQVERQRETERYVCTHTCTCTTSILKFNGMF